MPFYLLRCDKCAKDVEVFQSMSESLPDCKICGGQLRKRYGSFGVTTKDEKVVKAGNKVQEFLEQAREDLKDAKREMEQKSK